MDSQTIGTNTLYCGDSRELIDTISFDAVVTDPPYGIGGQKNPKAAYVGAFSQRDDTSEYIRTMVVPLIRHCIDKARCVILTPGSKNLMLYPQPDSIGGIYTNAAVGMTRFGWADLNLLLYYGKSWQSGGGGTPTIFELREVITSHHERINHPCPKPLKVWSKVVFKAARAGQTVFDPFMGAGTTAIACADQSIDFVGCEINRQYFDEACQRVESATAQQRLFA